jgi:rubrerythrin
MEIINKEKVLKEIEIIDKEKVLKEMEKKDQDKINDLKSYATAIKENFRMLKKAL